MYVKSEWISVNKLLPGTNNLVLTYRTDKKTYGISALKVADDGTVFAHELYKGDTYPVKYWFPLPEYDEKRLEWTARKYNKSEVIDDGKPLFD